MTANTIFYALRRTGIAPNRHIAFGILLLTCWTATCSAQPIWQRHVIDETSVGADGVRLADFNDDGKLDIVTGWEQGGIVRIYLQPKPSARKRPWPRITVGKAPSVEDAVAVDLEGDGMLEVVSLCEGSEQSIRFHWPEPTDNRHLSPDASDSPESAEESPWWKTEPLPASIGKQQWMYCLPMQIDGQHGPDLVVGSKGPNAAVGWWQSPENPRDLSAWRYHQLAPASWIMSIVATDLDRDGSTDIIYSDRKGSEQGIYLLRREPATDETAHLNPTPKFERHLLGGSRREVMFLELADLDQDGWLDIVAPTWNSQILLLRRIPETLRFAPYSMPLPFGLQRGKSVTAADFDRDGSVDLISTSRSEPASGPAVALTRFHPGPFANTSDIGGPDGSKFDLLVPLDIDDDGDLDIITCEEVANLGVIWYENPKF